MEFEITSNSLDQISADGIVVFADRKSTRLNSSHSQISYAVFCLKKKKKNNANRSTRHTFRYDAVERYHSWSMIGDRLTSVAHPKRTRTCSAPTSPTTRFIQPRRY